MSRVTEEIPVKHDIETTKLILRKALQKYGSIINNGNEFIIKEISIDISRITAWPSKATINLTKLGERGTNLEFVVSNFGIGPIQTNHCKSQLGALTNAFRVELDAYASMSKPSNNFSVADELIKLKSLLDAGVITQEEFNKKKKELI